MSGTVTDGSGHKWPLYAKITIPGDPGSPVYTSPYTGRYSITLPAEASYTLTVAPVYAGYNSVTSTVTLGAKDVTRNIKAGADTSACDAPGYSWNYDGGTGTDFTGWTGTTPRGGWKNIDTEGNGEVWAFNDPGNEGNLTGGSGAFAEMDAVMYGHYNVQNTSLESPVINLSSVQAPQIGFDTYFSALEDATGDVDLSLDGGKTWTTVWQQTGFPEVQGPVTVPIPQAGGQSDVRIRFHFTGAGLGLWEVDNVFVGTQPTCAVSRGGLVAGVVTDANTGNPVNGATVTVAARHASAGTSAAIGDPAIPGGFYVVFSPTGQQNVTVTGPGSGYTSASASVDITRNTVTQQNLTLQAGQLSVTPSSSSVTETLGQAGTVNLTYTNNGSSALLVQLGAQDGGYTPTPTTGAEARTAPERVAWGSIASYPIPVEDSAVATDPQTGDVYSMGGYQGISPGNTTASYMYDPAAGQWSPIASLPQAVRDARAAFVNGTLYVVGGQVLNQGNPLAVATVYAYNPGANSWSQMASLPQAVEAPGIAVLDGQMYVIGGCTQGNESSGSGCFGGMVRQVYRYDPTAGTWSAVARYPVPVGDESCAGIDGQVACAGGQTTPAGPIGNVTRQTWLYNPASNHWSQGADIPYPDANMAYADANGKLQVAGGTTGEDPNYTYTTRASQYDPASNTWTSLPSLSEPISDAGGACGMYVIGGYYYVPHTDAVQQTAEQLPGYDQCDGAEDTGWVKPSQTSLTLAPEASATITVRLDSAKVTQPGTYQAMIYAAANAPYPVQVATVTMEVQPPSGWIRMHGTVTSSSGTPVAGATVQIDTSAASVKSGPVDFTVLTGTNGRYQWWLDPAADDPLQVIAAKDGYIQQVVTIPKSRASLGFKLSPFPSVPY